jgi:hypothetical protein
MATISTLLIGGSVGVPAGHSKSSVVQLDFEDLLTDFIAAGGVTTDSAKLMTIPANTFVEVLHAEVIGANISLGAGPALSIGDTGSATLYVNAASTVTDGTDLTIATASKLYTAADYLRVTITGGTIAAGGGIRLVVRLTDTTRVEPAKPKVYTNV